MTDEEFRQWVKDLRSEVLYAWDVLGLPPITGRDEEDLRQAFKSLRDFPVHEFECIDELTGDFSVIRNTHTAYSGIVNGFFPTMMKTKINYSNKGDGQSIYDWFADDSLFERHVKYCRRHFKKDSFYAYSNPVKSDIIFEIDGEPFRFTSGEGLLNTLFKDGMPYKEEYDYWLSPRDEEEGYSGYNENLKNQRYLTIKRDWDQWASIPERCKTNIKDGVDTYQIRIFKNGQKLFPLGFKAFRVSYCQYAVNFPCLTAKYLYEKYTNHCQKDKVIIWDPSAGWGGRILGAMSVKDDRNIHYIGTDPNTDHNTENGRTKYHEIADMYNQVANEDTLFEHCNSYEIYQCGSEVMSENPRFQYFKGKLDLVFTSPPYFAKEAYSADPEQSCHKFPTYEGWREGFLKPTLTTAYNWLKNDRYLLWNIADVKFGKDMLPLEKDSIDICESLGFEYKGIQKMSLAAMPGANRINEDGTATAKNSCKINGQVTKYEPVLVFYKK